MVIHYCMKQAWWWRRKCNSRPGKKDETARRETIIVLSSCPSSLVNSPSFAKIKSYFCFVLTRQVNSFTKHKLGKPQDIKKWEDSTVSGGVWSAKQNPLQIFQGGRDFIQGSGAELNNRRESCTQDAEPPPAIPQNPSNNELRTQIFNDEKLVSVFRAQCSCY